MSMTPEKKLARNARNTSIKAGKALDRAIYGVRAPEMGIIDFTPRAPHLSWIGLKTRPQADGRKGRSGRKPEHTVAVVDNAIGQLAEAEEAKRKSDELEKLRETVPVVN